MALFEPIFVALHAAGVRYEVVGGVAEALFVQSASGFTSEDGSVTLHGLAASTMYFADRPQREVGT